MQEYVSARIVGLRQEHYGLVITAENGPTKLEFATNNLHTKRELRIGMQIRGTLEIVDN